MQTGSVAGNRLPLGSLPRGPIDRSVAWIVGATVLVAALVALLRSAPWATPGAALAADRLAPLRESEVIGIYLNPLVWLSFAAIFALEAALPAESRPRLPRAHLVQDALYFPIGAVFRVLLLGWYVALLHALYERHLSFLTIHALAAWPLWARAILAVLIGDLLGYLHHVARHRVPLFWSFHAVHHSQPHLNLSTDVRVHPVDRLVAQTVQFVPLLMVADSLPTMAGYLVFHQIFTKFYHANIRTDLGVLRWLLVTPLSHRVHHSVALAHRDANFGVIFSVWDRLFGTHLPGTTAVERCGIDDPSFPLESDASPHSLARSSWQQLAYPFRAPRPAPVRADVPGPTSSDALASPGGSIE